MKKTLFLVVILMLAFSVSCKRSDVADPDAFGSSLDEYGEAGGQTHVVISGTTYSYVKTIYSPINFVQVTLSGTDPQGNTLFFFVYSDSQGRYSFNVPVGSTDITVTPKRDVIQTWQPENRSIPEALSNLTGQDFFGTTVY